MNWAQDKTYVEFVTGLNGNSVLLKRVEKWVRGLQKEYSLTQRPCKSYHRFTYQAGSWKNPQRVIVKIEVNGQGTSIRFVLTSFKNTYSRTVYETLYCDRARMELMIKEAKTYLFADRMSCHRFAANQFRLSIYSAAYVLLHAMKTELSAGTSIQSLSILTLREKVLLTAVLIKTTKRTVKVSFPEQHPFREEIERAMHRIRLLRYKVW